MRSGRKGPCEAPPCRVRIISIKYTYNKVKPPKIQFQDQRQKQVFNSVQEHRLLISTIVRKRSESTFFFFLQRSAGKRAGLRFNAPRSRLIVWAVQFLIYFKLDYLCSYWLKVWKSVQPTDWLICRLCAQFIISKSKVKLGTANVSHCQQQQSYSGLRSPGQSYSVELLSWVIDVKYVCFTFYLYSTYLWNDE